MNRRAPDRTGIAVVRGLADRPRHLPLPTTVIWRWRWELGLTVAGAALLWLGWQLCGGWVLVIPPLLGTTVALIPAVRQWLLRRAWAVIVQHRVRVGCSEAALHGRRGQLPAVLWTQTRSYGERVHLWCPAAVTSSDFIIERERLAVACWARSVEVSRSPRWAQIVVLDVVRRNWDDRGDTTARGRGLPLPRRQQEA